MGFKVLNGTLAVIRDEPEKLSSGGIVLTTDEHLHLSRPPHLLEDVHQL